MAQAVLLSCPLKQTNEIDWAAPLKHYIRMNYDDQPEKYSDECATLNRLRQDMRGAGSDSVSGRDILYRYYGQLEILDLRFPVDENNIKISFTWYDAFINKPTSQYSLAFEKASVIFNIAAILSCHAVAQDLSDDLLLNTAYYGFMFSAGMFTYINENFLHAPSTDLSRDTVKTLIQIMIAQANELALLKNLRKRGKSKTIARLAAGAQSSYAQAKESIEAEAVKNVFDPLWMKVIQIKALHIAGVAQYYQALSDAELDQAGSAVARLQLAEKSSKQACTLAKSLPATPSPASNLGAETASTLQTQTKKQLEMIQEKLPILSKDNDFIYHQSVPVESTLPAIEVLQLAAPQAVSELYKEKDLKEVIGPDIFEKIWPIWVIEAENKYIEFRRQNISDAIQDAKDEEQLIQGWLASLKLPGLLRGFRGASDRDLKMDDQFEKWCHAVTDHSHFMETINKLQEEKKTILANLSKCSQQLNMEESICEKMRSKYDSAWTQQPSSRLNSTLRGDIKSYQDTLSEATNSDNQLLSTAQQYESDFKEMADAAANREVNELYQRTLRGIRNSDPSGRSEQSLIDTNSTDAPLEMLAKIKDVEVKLAKFDQLRDSRDKIILKLNAGMDPTKNKHDELRENILHCKRMFSSAEKEKEFFKGELSRHAEDLYELQTAVHRLKERQSVIESDIRQLLSNPDAIANQNKAESNRKLKASVMGKYNKYFRVYTELADGTRQAENFYSEMRGSVDSLSQNVEAFLSNRRAEGAQLLNRIEQNKSAAASNTSAAENERLQSLMARLSMEPTSSGPGERPSQTPGQPPHEQQVPASIPTTNQDPRFTIPPRESPVPVVSNGYTHPLNRANSQGYVGQTSPKSPDVQQQHQAFGQAIAAPPPQGYNPMAYPERKSPQAGSQSMQQYRYTQSPPQQSAQLSSPLAYQQGYFPPQSHTPQPQSQPPPQQMHHHGGIQSPIQPMNFTSPTSQFPPHMQYPQQQIQQSHPQFPYQQPQAPYQQPYPGHPYSGGQGPMAYNVPQGYMPPPPPPGPPGGGSTTQYPPPQQGPWPSGPGGYANYPRPPTGQDHRREAEGQGQQQAPNFPGGKPAYQGQGDVWAGLSEWK